MISVGRKSYTQHLALGLAECVKSLASDAPEFDCLIRAGGCDQGTGRVKIQIIDRSVMTVQSASRFARGTIPNDDRFVIAARGDPFSISAGAGTVDCIGVALQALLLLTVVDV